LELLEDRRLLSINSGSFPGEPPNPPLHPFPDGLNYADPVIRAAIANITTTAPADVGVYAIDPEPLLPSEEAPGTNLIESSDLINLTAFRNDTRFAGIDGSGFAVAILDTGIDLNHPFFGPDQDSDGVADRIVYNQDFVGGDPNANDVNGHGTNVSSIAASSDSTFTGMAPGADIIHLQVLNDSGSGTAAALESALQWVVANASTYNIASINMSLGFGDNNSSPNPRPELGINDELAALVAQGVIIASSSGNSFFGHGSVPGVGYPSADPSSLSVGAVWDSNEGGPILWSGGAIDFSTGADRLTSFSQRHPTQTTILAPGAFITGAGVGGGTSRFAGTSQASPHIAGIAALIQELAVQATGSRLTQAEFAALLNFSGATTFDGDDEDDNVTNTQADYHRVDVLAMANTFMVSSGVVGNVVVGVDFDVEGGSSPDNWTLFSGGDSDNVLYDLVNEAGVRTPFDLSISTSGTTIGAAANTVDPITIPTHSQPLDDLGGSIVEDGATWSFIWSGLSPLINYEVYVLGLNALSGGNDVEISGFDPPISFTQTLTADQLNINDELGDDTRELRSFGEVVKASLDGTITLTVSAATGAVSPTLGGLAIRPIGELGAILGQKWYDTDTDGVKDSNEPGLEGWEIFLDSSGSRVINSVDVPKAIPDLSQSISTLNVGGLGAIIDLNVTLDITHTWDGDLVVFLISPSGTRVELFSGVGGSGNNFTNTTLDDEAATSITNGTAPFTGSYRPVGLLSDFDGESPIGTWALEINDVLGLDMGTLNSWSLTLEGQGVVATTTDAEGRYWFADLVPGSYSVLETLQTDWRQTAPGTTAELTLDELIAGNQSIVDLIPDRFEFTEGDLGSYIVDGGEDMYDYANFLNTNLATLIPYTNGVALPADDLFGPGSKYFTAKFPGLFTLVATGMSIDSFSITGDNGTDGQGSVDGVKLATTVDDRPFTLFVKRVHSADDPSINHIIIVPGDGTGIDHAFPQDTNNDFHSVDGLGSTKELFYLLVSRNNGAYLESDDVLDIAEEFLSNLIRGVHVVNVTGGRALMNVDFGNVAPPSSIQGRVWNDLNADGKSDGEIGLEGWTVYLDGNNNGAWDSGPQYFESSQSQPISDLFTTTSQLTVDAVGKIEDVNITLDIAHTYDADLDVFLISPFGTRVELFSDIGSSLNNFQNTTLDDQAAASITTGQAPFTGTYLPEGLLASFVGENLNGIWTLEITDDAGEDVGTLNSWSLTITASEMFTTTDANGDYQFLDLPARDYTLAMLPEPGYEQVYPTGAAPHLLTIGTDEAETDVNFGARVAAESFTLVGDYNSNGTVDAADYTVLRDTMGSTTDMRADGNGNHVIDEGDFLMWRSHFGEVMPLGGGAAAASASARPPRAPSIVANSAPVVKAALPTVTWTDEKEKATLASHRQPSKILAPLMSQTETNASASHELPFAGLRHRGPVRSVSAPLLHVLPSQDPRQDRLLLAWLASLDLQYPSSDVNRDAFVVHQAADDRLSDCEAVDELFGLLGVGQEVLPTI
jgi:subtilisin-like proprotein convertase family protein/subtilisin family serine protease